VKRVCILLAALTFFVVGQPAGAREQSAGTGLPKHGVLQFGKKLAGIGIGDTDSKVRALWGTKYEVCPNCSSETWYYLYGKSDPLGAGVTFKAGRVVAVYTLGAPMGWRTTDGLVVGDQVARAKSLYGSFAWHVCFGYVAMTKPAGSTKTSIYLNMTGDAVAGFALTARSEPVCQ
jgi:hypothetical protein